MSRFDELYAKTHPVVKDTEELKHVESAVEDFDENGDVEETEETEETEQEGEGEDADTGDSDSN